MPVNLNYKKRPFPLANLLTLARACSQQRQRAPHRLRRPPLSRQEAFLFRIRPSWTGHFLKAHTWVHLARTPLILDRPRGAPGITPPRKKKTQGQLSQETQQQPSNNPGHRHHPAGGFSPSRLDQSRNHSGSFGEGPNPAPGKPPSHTTKERRLRGAHPTHPPVHFNPNP